MSKIILQADNICKAYIMGRSPLQVLRGASLSIHEGEFAAIMGSSGSGKSTLMHIIGALDLPDRGSVIFDRRDVFAQSRRERERLRNTQVGFIFQFYHLLPELNVFENILLPHMIGCSILGWPAAKKELKASASEAMEAVGLKDRARHRPNELSGGERQRAAIARAIVTKPRLLLADEPTGNLDRKTGLGILAVLDELHKQGQTIVMVTHDQAVADRADRILNLVEGRVQTD